VLGQANALGSAPRLSLRFSNLGRQPTEKGQYWPFLVNDPRDLTAAGLSAAISGKDKIFARIFPDPLGKTKPTV